MLSNVGLQWHTFGIELVSRGKILRHQNNAGTISANPSEFFNWKTILLSQLPNLKNR